MSPKIKSFNNFMHPRNEFKIKPNYEKLAEKYADFKSILVEYPNHKFKIDNKNPKSLKLLSTILLKEYFDLGVDLPLNRLIPAVPQRLNYILWIEDIIYYCFDDLNIVNGIDIGTGASCIFPLLGCRRNDSWNFIATELDDFSLENAKKNTTLNSFNNRIKVIKENFDNLIIFLNEEFYHFLMCNPPFFSENFSEKINLENNFKNKKYVREPRTNIISIDDERITKGGEVTFVKKLFDQSFIYKDKIKIFSVMLGKKQSLKLLKNEFNKLSEDKILTYIDAEFCQGNTIRWGLCWTFDMNINLKKVPKMKHSKPQKKFNLIIDKNKYSSCTLLSLKEKIALLLDEISLENIRIIKNSYSKIVLILKANLDTWSNQRRRKRQEKKMIVETFDSKEKSDRLSQKRNYEEQADLSDELNLINIKKKKTLEKNYQIRQQERFLLDCKLTLKILNEDFVLEMISDENAINKEATHQLFTYLKNNL